MVGPIVLAALISLAFGDEGFDATIGVVDEDGSELSGRFVDGVESAEGGGLSFDVLASAAAARTAVDDGDVGAAIVVPEGFSDSLSTDSPGDLVVLTSSDGAVSAEVARAVASNFTDRANAARLATAASLAAGGPAPSADVLADISLPVAGRHHRHRRRRVPRRLLRPVDGPAVPLPLGQRHRPRPAGRAARPTARPDPSRARVRRGHPRRQGGRGRRGRHVPACS